MITLEIPLAPAAAAKPISAITQDERVSRILDVAELFDGGVTGGRPPRWVLTKRLGKLPMGHVLTLQELELALFGCVFTT